MEARRKKRESGQGMTEYIIIVAIIAIGAILVIGLFGKQVKTAFSKVTYGISAQRDSKSYLSVNADDIKQNAMDTFDTDTTADN